jgi:hypothetical protein
VLSHHLSSITSPWQYAAAALKPPPTPPAKHPAPQVQNSDKTSLLSVLLEGPAGAGTTALAATAAIESGFPFVKVRAPGSRSAPLPGPALRTSARVLTSVLALSCRSRHQMRGRRASPRAGRFLTRPSFLQVVSPEAMVGYAEPAKGSTATKIFEDAYKSPLSIVILVGVGFLGGVVRGG